MARKDISDVLVCLAYKMAHDNYKDKNRGVLFKWPYELLMHWTGEPEKVCLAAMVRAEQRDYLIVGVSLRAAHLSAKGLDLINPMLKDLGGGE